MVDISVLLPVFNHADFLPRALQALVAQEKAPREIIIVDDASTDGSAAVAEGMRGQFAPSTQLRILRNDTNLGVNRSLNRGLAEVQNPYVVCTAADDWLRPRFLAAMAEAAARFPDAHLITSRYVEFFERDDRMVEHGADSESGTWYAEDRRFFDPDAVLALFGRGPVTIPISASITRTATLLDLGSFDPALRWHADWFAATAIALRHGFAVVPEALAVFRIAEGTYSGDNVRRAERQREVCRAICDKLATPAYADLREKLALRPSPFAPFARYMLTNLARYPSGRPLLVPLTLWWLQQVLLGRRPGRVRALSQRLGINVVPH